MWLTDTEIQAHLDAATQERLVIAIDALYGRYEFGDPVNVTPLTADLLRVCTDELPGPTTDRFVDFVVGVDAIPSLPAPDNWREVIKAVCLYFGTDGAYTVALAINAHADGEALVPIVMELLERQLAETPDDRLFFAGVFLDRLMDAEDPIWNAILTALDRWSVTPNTHRVVAEVRHRLDEPRQARW